MMKKDKWCTILINPEVIHSGVKTINAKGSDIIIAVHRYDVSTSTQKDT